MFDRLDRVHREVDVRAEVFALGKLDEPGEPGDLGHEQHAAGAEVVGADGPPLGRLRLELGPQLVEAVLGEGEEDEPEHRPAVLRGREARVRAELVGRGPEPALELWKISRGHERRLVGSSSIASTPTVSSGATLRPGRSRKKRMVSKIASSVERAAPQIARNVVTLGAQRRCELASAVRCG